MNKSIIIMGVSGSGKSTIGKMLAAKIGFIFLDGDDFHPESNKMKMSAGIPLNDDDRFPWLTTLHQELSKPKHIVLACSALKEGYRTILDPENKYHWILLNGPKEILLERLNQRQGHFMKAEMLDSQLNTLEMPASIISADIRKSPEEICEKLIRELTDGE